MACKAHVLRDVAVRILNMAYRPRFICLYRIHVYPSVGSERFCIKAAWIRIIEMQAQRPTKGISSTFSDAKTRCFVSSGLVLSILLCADSSSRRLRRSGPHRRSYNFYSRRSYDCESCDDPCTLGTWVDNVLGNFDCLRLGMRRDADSN